MSETKIYEARRGTKAFLLLLLKLFRTKMFNHNVEGKSTSAILRKSILGVSHITIKARATKGVNVVTRHNENRKMQNLSKQTCEEFYVPDERIFLNR